VKANIMVSLSGGLDSACLLGVLANTPAFSPISKSCLAVNFYYGSKHNLYERRCAQQLSEHYGVTLREIDLDFMRDLKSTLLKGGGEIPEGHYEAETMRQTVVPGRNLVFLSIMSAIAESEGIRTIYIGAHSGDHHIYPDCRPEFFAAANGAINRSTVGMVQVMAPMILAKKKDIVLAGIKAKVPFAITRTCYTDDPVACGRCGSCQERLEAFALNNANDPIEYESRILMPK
jgi:7-cyano-7-deazaguanine synthase